MSPRMNGVMTHTWSRPTLRIEVGADVPFHVLGPGLFSAGCPNAKAISAVAPDRATPIALVGGAQVRWLRSGAVARRRYVR